MVLPAVDGNFRRKSAEKPDDFTLMDLTIGGVFSGVFRKMAKRRKMAIYVKNKHKAIYC